MTIHIILNPYANRWRAKRQVSRIESAMSRAGIDFRILRTEGTKHATDLARGAVHDGATAVVAAGGDGTVNEVVNGMLQAAVDQPPCPLGVIPVGNGNDFNDMMNLPHNLAEIAKIFAHKNTRCIDVGRVTSSQIGCHFFVNNCAAAMEPLVTLESSKLKRITGDLRYWIGLLRALTKLKAWNMSVQGNHTQLSGPTYLLSICNGPRVGRLFMMFPDAKFDDGQLDVVWAPKVSLRRVMEIVPRIFRGTHVTHGDVRSFQATEIRITSEPGTPVHCDGEMLGENWTEFQVELLPRKLNVLVPAQQVN